MKNNTAMAPPEMAEQLRQLLTENLAAFRRFAQRRLGDPELAADVVQDALLKALRAEEELRHDENLVAWFYRVLRNAIPDLHRKKATQTKALERFAIEMEKSPDAESHGVICECVTRLLPTLKPEYAEVIRRVDFDEQSTEEVAASLDIMAGNLKVRLHRARQQLKERLIETCRLCATHGCLDCYCETHS